MQPTWIIEKDVFPEDADAMAEAVQRAGLACIMLDGYECYERKRGELLEQELCAVFYGSLELAKYLRKCARWIPGIYWNTQAFNCTGYYAYLGRFLLNGNYIMLPFSELRRQKEFLYNTLSQDRAVFIRPNRGDKIFTGKVVYKEDFDKAVDLFGFYDPLPDELVIVSEPRNLAFEWRFVCVEGEIVAGSQYRRNERVEYAAGFPQGALDFAQEISKHYTPDPAWVIDVCQTKAGEYRLMEVGCFSCCGLYHCDRDAIVQAVSKAATQEWETYQGDKA